MIKQFEVDVKLLPSELAEMFWDLDADEQAKFFNCLGSVLTSSAIFQTQMDNVVLSDVLSDAGKYAMQAIGRSTWD